MIANNSFYLVLKEGDYNVKTNISNDGVVSLKYVYHVQSLKKNLISISQLVNSKRYVLFSLNDI